MPGDLSNPETSPFDVGRYESRYEPGANTFESGTPDLEGVLQAYASQELGKRLDKERMRDLILHLDSKGYLHRNWGDESFREEVSKFLKTLSKARKVARKWLT